MNTVEFFRAILPPEGVYIIATPYGESFKHRGFESIEEAAAFAQQCDARGITTYHACAAYKRKPYKDENGKFVSRKPVNWLSAKAFWCDIDCGQAKYEKGEGYLTQKEGAKALLTWCKEKGLPFPMLVNSGRGIHAYWCLTEDLFAEEWYRTAATLKKLMDKDGLITDPHRTADFASVLRPVGTHHRKDPSNPREVKIAMAQKELIPTADFVAKVAELLPSDELPPPPPWMAKGEMMPLGYTPMDSSAELCADKCAQMAQMRDTQGDVSYDHWRGVIGIIKHCTEGIELAEAWSAKRAETGHNNCDVQTRYDTWDSGPTTCEFFGKCNPAGCTDCPFAGKIKTPLVLGRVEPETKQETAEGVFEEDHHQTSVQVEVPELPDGYAWDGSHMVHYVPNKDGVLEAHPFCRTWFYLIDRIRNDEGKFEFVAQAHFPKGVIRRFNLAGSLIGAGGGKLLEALGAYEIMVSNAKDAAIQMNAYLKDAVNKLTAHRDVTSTHTSYGWQPDGSFLIGTRLYKPNGTLVEALLSGYAWDKRTAFPRPQGTVEGYAQALNWVYNREGMEPMQYLICSLFAAPLVDFCEPTYNGIPCAMTGADSGKGKTTAATAALYAFGRAFPDMIISGKQGATAKAQAALLGAFSSLPCLFDEITNIQSRNLSDLCYALSNGVENMRLRAGSGGVRFAERESWRTHVAMTGNTCLAERLTMEGNAEAESMRVLEIRIDQYDIPKLDPIAVSTSLAEMERNMGCAGEKYIQYLVKNREAAKGILLDSYNLLRVDADLVSEPKYRFYRNHMACTLAAARIMKDLGVIEFDLEKLRDFAVDAVRRAFEESKELNTSDPIEVFTKMVSDLAPRIITTQTFGVGKNEPPVLANINGTLAGRAIKGSAGKHDKYDGKMWLAVRAVRDWCVSNRVDATRLGRELRARNIVLDRRALATLGRGTTIISAQQRCWEVSLTTLEGYENGHQN